MAPASEEVWYSSLEEYRFLESIVIVFMTAGALFFDSVMHVLRKVVLNADQRPRHDDIPYFYEALFNRASGELMVLGFLAFVVWSLSRWGAFDEIVAQLPSSTEPPEGSLQKRERFSYPTKGSDLLHVVEDVHMQLFVAMLLYFGVQFYGIKFVKRTLEKWASWEHAQAPPKRPSLTRMTKSRARRLVLDLVRPLVVLRSPGEYALVKQFYVSWARSGALEYVEERRRKKLERAGRRLQDHRPVMPFDARRVWADAYRQAGDDTLLRHRAKSAATARAAGQGRARPLPFKAPPGPEAPAPASAALAVPAHGRPRSSSTYAEKVAVHSGLPAEKARGFFSREAGGLVKIDRTFHFTEYLTLCFAEYLEELVEFKPAAWLLVMLMRGLEALALYGGLGAYALDTSFAVLTIACILGMLAVSKLYSASVIAEAERGLATPPAAPAADVEAATGKPSDLHDSCWVRLMRAFNAERHFLRLLQALTYRNLFRVAEWHLGPSLENIIDDGGPLGADGSASLALTIVMALSSALMPFIAFDWGLAMFLPPHIKEKTVEIAELVRAPPSRQRAVPLPPSPPAGPPAGGGPRKQVCWRQIHYHQGRVVPDGARHATPTGSTASSSETDSTDGRYLRAA